MHTPEQLTCGDCDHRWQHRFPEGTCTCPNCGLRGMPDAYGVVKRANPPRPSPWSEQQRSVGGATASKAELTPEDRAMMQELYRTVVEELAEGRSKGEIVRRL